MDPDDIPLPTNKPGGIDWFNNYITKHNFVYSNLQYRLLQLDAWIDVIWKNNNWSIFTIATVIITQDPQIISVLHQLYSPTGFYKLLNINISFPGGSGGMPSWADFMKEAEKDAPVSQPSKPPAKRTTPAAKKAAPTPAVDPEEEEKKRLRKEQEEQRRKEMKEMMNKKKQETTSTSPGSEESAVVDQDKENSVNNSPNKKSTQPKKPANEETPSNNEVRSIK